MKNNSRKRQYLRKSFLILCILAAIGMIAGCSRKADGILYLSGNSMLKLTVDSDAKMKDLVALNKTGNNLMEGQEWKGKQEIGVLEELIQNMQSEDAETIYIDVLSEDKSWEAEEIKKLSEHFMGPSYEGEIPVEVRKVTDLDTAEGSSLFSPGEAVEFSTEMIVESSASEDESESSQEIGESEKESSEGESTTESAETDETSTEQETTTASVPPTTAASTTAAPTTSAPTTAAPTTAPSTTAAPTTMSPAPEETSAADSTEPVPVVGEPETSETVEAEESQEPVSQKKEKSPSKSDDVYIPTKNTEEEESFGPGW